MSSLRTTSTILAIAIPTLTILTPIAYLTYKKSTLSNSVTINTIPDEKPFPPEGICKTLPPDLSPSEWVLSRETAVKTVKRSDIVTLQSGGNMEDLIVRALRLNMQFFAGTPQSGMMRRMVHDPKLKATFEPSYLCALDFNCGDFVTGVYRVVLKEAYDGGARVEMALDAPEGWKGPKSEGRIVARVEERGGEIVFTNDTLMWRRRQGGKPELLETTIGAWVHSLTIMWMLDSLVKKLTVEKQKAS